ncbi:MAG TPA: hypothetical protein VLG13_01595 [Patescibacteria group bacterium]|nr:hypothetical protein [Patescibacteria group bacterium]
MRGKVLSPTEARLSVAAAIESQRAYADALAEPEFQEFMSPEAEAAERIIWALGTAAIENGYTLPSPNKNVRLLPVGKLACADRQILSGVLQHEAS